VSNAVCIASITSPFARQHRVIEPSFVHAIRRLSHARVGMPCDPHATRLAVVRIDLHPGADLWVTECPDLGPSVVYTVVMTRPVLEKLLAPDQARR
jgi:hypothetical protein